MLGKYFYLYDDRQRERCGEMFRFKWMLGKMKGYRAVYAVALCLSVVIQSFFLTGPMIVEQIISIFISSPDALQNIENQRDLLILLCVAMILFVFVRTCLQFLAKTLYEIVSQGVLQKVRNELFERIQNQDMHFFDTHTKGDLVTRLTGDLDMIRHSIAWIIMMVVESGALFLFTVIYFFTIDWLMTLCILALTPILFIVTRMFAKRVGPKYVVLREKLSRLNTKAQENIAANRVVKAFAREDYEKEDFDKYNKDYCEHNQEAAMVWLTFQPYIETLAQALWAVQMLVGGIFVINGRITIAQYTVFSGLLWTIANAMRNIGMLINDLQRFFASISKIIEVYYSRPNIVNNHNSAERPRLKGDIEFKNVSAKFGDITVLHNIDLNIKHGETIVIMGSTGSGKTTLMKISAGLLQPTAGSVIIDKVPVGVFTKAVTSYLPDRMALPTEFTADDAVSLYADFFTDFDKVKANAMLADLHIGGRDKIDSMSKGTQEKMQLCLTMSRAAKLYLLDEPLGGVDPAARDYILSTILHNYSEDAALMLSTHLIGDIEKVLDEVILLQDGKVLRQTAVDELREETGESVDAYFREVYKC